MGTIQIKKVEKTVTTGKQGEERQKVKKTYGVSFILIIPFRAQFRHFL